MRRIGQADLRLTTWAVAWRKRQLLPMPQGTERRVWDQSDLDRDVDAFIAVQGGPSADLESSKPRS